MAHFITALMRWRCFRAISGRVSQMGSKTPRTSPAVILSTFLSARGAAWRASWVRHASAVPPPFFQPAECMAITCSTASAKVGMPAPRRGSPPLRTVRWLSNAASRASAWDTSHVGPSPMWVGLPLMMSRCTHDLVTPPLFDSRTRKISPWEPWPPSP